MIDLRVDGRIHKRDSLGDLSVLPCFERGAHGKHCIDAGHGSRERIRIPEVARHQIHTKRRHGPGCVRLYVPGHSTDSMALRDQCTCYRAALFSGDASDEDQL